MRLLADSSLHGGVVRALRAEGHDIDDVRLWSSDPGDSVILDRARETTRVLVTSDKDFGELAVFGGQGHAGVLILAQDMTVLDQIAACLSALASHVTELESGCLVLVGQRGVRLRRPQLP